MQQKKKEKKRKKTTTTSKPTTSNRINLCVGYSDEDDRCWLGMTRTGPTRGSGFSWLDGRPFRDREWIFGEPELHDTCAVLGTRREWIGADYCNDSSTVALRYSCVFRKFNCVVSFMTFATIYDATIFSSVLLSVTNYCRKHVRFWIFGATSFNLKLPKVSFSLQGEKIISMYSSLIAISAILGTFMMHQDIVSEP